MQNGPEEEIVKITRCSCLPSVVGLVNNAPNQQVSIIFKIRAGHYLSLEGGGGRGRGVGSEDFDCVTMKFT